ncbi:pepsin/retropepsin-like aspartic protease family protein [Edaphocola aurantiacus]|uniref:retroviral-like aspartic protease family protein n=1 Tax=Edaphocola aurantiacus TaxID=2601682 RepID=UPI001C944214|nr:retroviral-like aspartic protease family protein [Edaphocola aurantiacus]
MPIQTNTINEDRKIISQVYITNPNKEENSFEISALWDTGAVESTISQRAINSLELEISADLPPVIQVNAHGDEVQANRHSTCVIGITQNGQFSMEGLTTMGSERNGCDIIIGMDIISQLNSFTISGNEVTIDYNE